MDNMDREGYDIVVWQTKLTVHDVGIINSNLSRDICRDIYKVCRQNWTVKTEERMHNLYHRVYEKGIRFDTITRSKTVFIRINVNHQRAVNYLNEWGENCN